MAKRIVLCFDGTWNTPGSSGDPDRNEASTNVWKFFKSVLPSTGHGQEDGPAPVGAEGCIQKSGSTEDGTTQFSFYDPGVGTDGRGGIIHDWLNHVAGGAFGLGLDQKIKDGYRALASQYVDGDHVYILGFSRGAYTARSLVGLIRNAGLLPADRLDQIDAAYALYRKRDDGPDVDEATQFRQTNGSRLIPIHFLGVWDTVGALGVPLGICQHLDETLYGFHDTTLNWWVKNAFQALAIDEHRKTFAASLWDPGTKPTQRMEQRWFVGCHSNVGGGYADDKLSDIALAWMMERAAECGLALDPEAMPEVTPDNALGTIVDSYGQFLDGLGKLAEAPYYRPVCVLPYSEEDLHDSVVRRADKKTDYNPPNIGFRKALVQLTPVREEEAVPA